MNTATNIQELAMEFLRFEQSDKDSLDFKDHIMIYDSLNQKLEEAGMSYYEISVYAKSNNITLT